MKIEDTNLQAVTGLFVQKDLKLRTNFSKTFNNLQTFDNSNNLTQTINSWIKNATNGLIPAVVENVKDAVKMVVVNGVAFKVSSSRN